MKKTIALFFAVLALLSLAACAGDSTPSSEVSAEPTAEPTSPPPTEPTVEPTAEPESTPEPETGSDE